MPKAIEALSGTDAAIFREAVSAALAPEVEQLGDHEGRLAAIEDAGAGGGASAAVDFVLAADFRQIGDGANWQPAIQRAVDHAVEQGVAAVHLPAGAIESWQMPFDAEAAMGGYRGNHLLIAGNVALIGAATGTTIVLKGVAGVARSNADGSGSWMSGWLMYVGLDVTTATLRNITVDGGLTFANVTSNAESNVQDKGVIFANWPGAAHNMARIDFRNVALHNFAGEIFYMGGEFADCDVYVENCRFTGSPQCAWNPGALCRIVAVNLEAGDSYQAAETVSGRGHLYVGGRFFNSNSSAFITTEAFDPTFPYNYPLFTESLPCWTRFEGTRFERCGQTILSSRTSGWIVSVDVSFTLANYGKLCDIDLEIEAWCDASNNANLIWFPGVAGPAVQVPNAPAGTHYETARDIRVRIVARRTGRAHLTGRWKGIAFVNGQFDVASCVFEIVNAGDAVNGGPIDLQFSSAATQFPLVLWDDTFGMVSAANAAPSADFSIDAPVTHLAVSPQTAGTFTMTLTNSLGHSFAEGQRLRVWYWIGAAGRAVLMPATGHGYRLPQDRTLAGPGDYVDLRWNSAAGIWQEAACSTQ